MIKMQRNDKCWCNSGKKYKICHEMMDNKIQSFADKGHIIPTRDMIKTQEQIEKIR